MKEKEEPVRIVEIESASDMTDQFNALVQSPAQALADGDMMQSRNV